MLALRQVSNSLRFQALRSARFGVGCVQLDNFYAQLESKANILVHSPPAPQQTCLFQFHHTITSASANVRGLSTNAASSSDNDAIPRQNRLTWVPFSMNPLSCGDDDDDEIKHDRNYHFAAIPGVCRWDGQEDEYFYADDIIEDDFDAIPGRKEWEGNEDELISDPEGSDPTKRPASCSQLFNAIVSNQSLSVETLLSNWVEQGKDLGRLEVDSAMLNLRKRRMYETALQLSKWLEANKKLDFVERDSALRLDLIAKVHGLDKAKSYLNSVPKSFRGEIIYRTLLSNCVIYGNVKLAEEVFNRMRELEFETTAFACNRLLILYKRMDKKKIAGILNLMKEEKVKYTRFTYNLLMDIKGHSWDISGMEEIFDTMKSQGVEPDITTQAIMAKHYAYYRIDEKAEAILKEMEGCDLKENRLACRFLLPFYAALEKADEVGRVWKVCCELSPRIDECVAAVEAWGRVERIDKAEACFEMMERKWKKLGSRHYSALLKVYANNSMDSKGNDSMVAKGNELVRKMADSGCGWKLSPPTWDTLVKQLVVGGAVEEADALLEELVRQTKMTPTMKSYMAVMDKYSEMGNVDKAEKLLSKMRQVGYGPNILQYQKLLEAYFRGVRPAYGMRDRLKADGIVPTTKVALMLEVGEASSIRSTA